MLSRKIVLAALLLYAVVLGCTMSPAGDEMSSVIASDANLAKIDGLRPYCGAALHLQRVDWVEDYKKTIDSIANDGLDTVSLVVDARQENAESTRMYVDMRMTPTVPQLLEIIAHAKARHLRVVLMPIVLLDNPADASEWRGTLKPTDWEKWFDNYRDMIEHYARIAAQGDVDLLVVGSELVSSEEHTDQWTRTIHDVRQIYHGQLTYSSNWDRYEKVKFWSQLDLIGMNSYWTLGKDHNASLEEISASWQHIQDGIFAFQKSKAHKPVILLEAGWCSLSNAAKDPWDYTQTQLDADTELQRKLYEGFFQSWWGKSESAGFMIWEFHPGGDDSEGKGYTPQGKPAEQVLRTWMSKPRWNIMLPQ